MLTSPWESSFPRCTEQSRNALDAMIKVDPLEDAGGVRRRHSFGLANHLLNTSLLTVPPGNTRLAAMTSTPTATITVA
jgi:hypothetical protein